ncbi:hypothetical protein ZWY2020_060018 [Hordeum vulgare]|nr:hypothetical protein ZWY2020_060018 [Hordeum vulgare]
MPGPPPLKERDPPLSHHHRPAPRSPPNVRPPPRQQHLSPLHAALRQRPPLRRPQPARANAPPTSGLPNSLLRSYTGLGHHREAVALYSRMRAFDHLTFPLAAKACAGLRLGRHGRAVHCRSLAAGFGRDAYVQNALISMYMSCGDVDDAEAVFGAMKNRSVVSWNAVIAGCVKNGCAERALEVFGEMVADGAGVDRATVVSVLPACARAKNLSIGRAVHRLVEERGLGDYAAVKNALIDMYGKCAGLEEARRVFDGHKYDKNVVSWTVMIGAYVLNDRVDEAFNLVFDMLMTGGAPWPNGVTMAYLLSACSSLPSWRRAKCTHAMCIRLGLQSDIVVETALIDTYAKCHKMKMMELTLRNGSWRTETWNAAISGYSRSEQEKKAVGLFKRMIGESVRPDSATLASILPAYAESADLRQARNIHCFLLTLGFLRSTAITTGLVDVYAKAGDLDIAWTLFDRLPEKDVIAWTAILTGYGMAVCDECKLKFQELKAKSFRFIVFKINEKVQQVVVDRVGEKNESYDDFAACLPADECRYAVFDFDFVTDENCQKSKIFFISWAPDTSRVRSKMLYASSKDRFKRELDGIQVELQATDPSEMSMDIVKARAL